MRVTDRGREGGWGRLSSERGSQALPLQRSSYSGVRERGGALRPLTGPRRKQLLK